MRDALLVIISMSFGWALGFLTGRHRRQMSSRQPAPKTANGNRKVEIALKNIEPCGTGKINLSLVCLLCDMPWRFTNAGHTDNVFLNCPRCGARETSDDVRAALRRELRATLVDAPPETA